MNNEKTTIIQSNLVESKINNLLEQVERIKNISQESEIITIITTALDETTEFLRKVELSLNVEYQIKLDALDALKKYKEIIDDEGEEKIDSILSEEVNCTDSNQTSGLKVEGNNLNQQIGNTVKTETVENEIKKKSTKKDRNVNGPLDIKNIFMRHSTKKVKKPLQEICNKLFKSEKQDFALLEDDIDINSNSSKIEDNVSKTSNEKQDFAIIEDDIGIESDSNKFEKEKQDFAMVEDDIDIDSNSNKVDDNVSKIPKQDFAIIEDDIDVESNNNKLENNNSETSNEKQNFAMIEDDIEIDSNSNKTEDNKKQDFAMIEDDINVDSNSTKSEEIVTKTSKDKKQDFAVLEDDINTDSNIYKKEKKSKTLNQVYRKSVDLLKMLDTKNKRMSLKNSAKYKDDPIKQNNTINPELSSNIEETCNNFTMLDDSSGEEEENKNKFDSEISTIKRNTIEGGNFAMISDTDEEVYENVLTTNKNTVSGSDWKLIFEDEENDLKPNFAMSDNEVVNKPSSRDDLNTSQTEYFEEDKDDEPVYAEIDTEQFSVSRKIRINQNYEIMSGSFQMNKFIMEEESYSRGQPDGNELEIDKVAPLQAEPKLISKDHKNQIIKELIDTEEKYINSLEYVIKEYIEYLIKSGITSKSKDQFNSTLGSIASICNESKIFLYDLRRYQNDYNQLGFTFLKHKKLFERYPLYCKYKCVSTEMLTGTIRELIAKKENELDDKLGLNSRLMHPIQRMGKYELLLKELWKCLKNEDKPLTAIDNAISFIRNVAQTCDSLILLESIKGKSFNMIETGDFIKRDIFRTFTPKDQQIVIFLFKNLIVFTEEDLKIKDAFNYKDHVLKNDIIKIDCTDAGLRFKLYCKTSSNATFIYELEATDRQSKADWNKMLSEIIQTNVIFDTRIIMRSKSDQNILPKPSNNKTFSSLLPFRNKNHKEPKKSASFNN